MEINRVLDRLRQATAGTEYEGKLFLVGGYVRDKLLGRTAGGDDLDLVLEGDADAVCRLLWEKRVASHPPVTYPSFGTAMVHVGGSDGDRGVQVEFVTAREETYRQKSRKPIVRPGTLRTDALRRDFTVNTLMESLHTGEVLDLTGQGRADLAAGILRTPLEPVRTFADDPLRMLRACRFAAKLGFVIAGETLEAIVANADKCNPENDISWERIRDEFFKTVMARQATVGLNLMRETRLLDQFAPELAALFGVTQNRFHLYDVWTHTLVALANLPPETTLPVRLATIFHDIGKPVTRTVDERGEVHFYDHETVGERMTREILTRLRCPNELTEQVATLVALHMRYGAYREEVWSDAAVRRLIRSVGPHREALFTIARADIAACNTTDYPSADLDGLRARMDRVADGTDIAKATSPIDGQRIIALGATPGPQVGRIKAVLTDAVVAGELAPDDIEGAEAMARRLLRE
ncbi:MAG: HD domain-containing protein [Capsulimonadales bacterium]|nr:HD domain-containing protein [Capsulimonadales bacterium]